MQPRILVLYNEPTLPPDHPDADSEHDILYTADTIARILQQAGVVVERLGMTDNPAALIAGVKASAPDAIFNLYEGLAQWGNTEAYVSGLLELLRIPFTGSPTQPLLMCRSKPLTKQLLAGAGLPTAPFFVVEEGRVPKCPIKWPVIVKPGREDASVGIDQASVVTNQKQLESRVEYIRTTYGPSVLVERFIRGREFNVALIARDGELTTLPFSEILFVPPDDSPNMWPIVSFDAKWRPGTRDFTATPAKNPAEVTPELHHTVSTLAKKAFELVGCRDYARVDFRLDDEGEPFILEVNPNPCISPLAGLAAGLESAKIPYPEFIVGLVKAALLRSAKPTLAGAVRYVANSEAVVVPHGPLDIVADENSTFDLRLRPAKRGDLPQLLELIDAMDHLPADDRKLTAKRLHETLTRKDAQGRQCVVLATRDTLAGFACFQLTDASQGATTLETLCVAPAHRKQGHGRSLFKAVEEAVAMIGGRLLMVHVSSGPMDAPARQFLHRVELRAIGELAEYFRDGYARLTFAKPITVVAPAPVSPVGSSVG